MAAYSARLGNSSCGLSISAIPNRLTCESADLVTKNLTHFPLEDNMTPEITVNHMPNEASTSKFARVYLPAIIRVLIGLAYLIFGLNGFLNFIPQPTTPMPENATAFLGGLMKSGYMFPLIAVTHLVVGALLVSNRYVPLALALIAPFTVNSMLFHMFLEHSGLPMAIIFLALELYLVWVYRHAFRAMLAARVAPFEK
jgi:hypothetical protein